MTETIVSRPEGRRLEFKETLPEKSDLAKTIIAFANDAGGDLFVGIKDSPREIVGLPEDELFSIEEQISNIIFTRCYPVILPEITFLTIEGKHIIRVTVYRGNTPPYHLKDKGAAHGTYIRVGSTNRLAEDYMVTELERRKRNIRFDGETVMEKPLSRINIDTFKATYKEKTGESVDESILKKLELVTEIQNEQYPTNALLLFSDDELRNRYFRYAKVECARFKGTTSETFIDRKTIDVNISLQAEEAYNFVLRHINQGAVVEGVYTVARWEYPVNAIREVIRNAVVHRDYSLQGKDIKIAVYDDMVEITNPGLIPSSVDFSQMESGQSDARNRVIAPVFKRLGIIDQWGNGLKLIANELRQYPEIEFVWKEVGLSFQAQFVKKNFESQPDTPYEDVESQGKSKHRQPMLDERQPMQPNLQPMLEQAQQELRQIALYKYIVLKLQDQELSVKEMSEVLGQKDRSGQLKKAVKKLLSDNLIERTIPENPNHPLQKLRLTEQGRLFLKRQPMLEERQPMLQPMQPNLDEIQQEFRQELWQTTLYTEVMLKLQEQELSVKEMSEVLGQKDRSGQLKKVIKKLLSDNLIERTIPHNPKHPLQKLHLTERGRLFLKLVNKE